MGRIGNAVGSDCRHTFDLVELRATLAGGIRVRAATSRGAASTGSSMLPGHTWDLCNGRPFFCAMGPANDAPVNDAEKNTIAERKPTTSEFGTGSPQCSSRE